jgi:hypothetical protein
MKTREEVKKGMISLTDAMARISPDCDTYKWCQRRMNRKAVVTDDTEAKPKQRKYRHGKK